MFSDDRKVKNYLDSKRIKVNQILPKLQKTFCSFGNMREESLYVPKRIQDELKKKAGINEKSIFRTESRYKFNFESEWFNMSPKEIFSKIICK